MAHAPTACGRCKKYKKACDKRLAGCLRCTRLVPLFYLVPRVLTIAIFRLSVKCVYSPPAGMVQWTKVASLGHLLSRGTVEVENQVTNESLRIVDAMRRADLQSMTDTYFNTLHVSLPFVNRADFDTALISYADKSDAQQHRRTNLSHFSVLLLSIILTAHLSSKIIVRNKEIPVKLYDTAKSLYSLVQSSGKISLELVQAGLNIAAYEHCQARGHDAWLTVGACARMAQVMGLHSTVKAGGKECSSVELETHKCVWWSVVVLERYF